MFVCDRRIKFRPLQNTAGIAHFERQRRRFRFGKAVEQHGHGKGADLAIGNAAVGDAVNEEGDFLLSEFPPVAFFANDFLRQHISFPLQ